MQRLLHPSRFGTGLWCPPPGNLWWWGPPSPRLGPVAAATRGARGGEACDSARCLPPWLPWGATQGSFFSSQLGYCNKTLNATLRAPTKAAEGSQNPKASSRKKNWLVFKTPLPHDRLAIHVGRGPRLLNTTSLWWCQRHQKMRMMVVHKSLCSCWGVVLNDHQPAKLAPGYGSQSTLPEWKVVLAVDGVFI
jgi:hypothetical protein